MRARARTIACLVAAYVLVAAPPAMGGGTARVAGVVTDSVSAAAVSGASVELSSPLGVLAQTTDARGRFSFLDVTPDTYQLTVAHSGFQSLIRDGITALPDRSVELSLSLRRGVTTLGSVEVKGRRGDLVGVAASASVGVVGPKEIAERPILRPGEVLETVPGVVISQHSGGGKANQYYLRGFNLDHGTDIAVSVAGMPANMRTHAHGQGYSDINWLIPELVGGVQYKKGPYAADEGDFSTSGAVTIDYASVIQNTLEFGAGQDGYGRILVAASPKVGAGNLLYAFEQYHEDGPWAIGDNYRRSNGVLRYSTVNPADALAVTAMAYQGEFHSSDQIPLRAVTDGQISRFGNIDPTDGGRTHRYSLSAQWQHVGPAVTSSATVYGIDYELNLFSDFTYFLERPATMDQFEQADKRFVSGLDAANTYQGRLGAWTTSDTIGVTLRNDNITTSGLFHTQAQREFETVAVDRVLETSEALYVQRSVKFSTTLRGIFGVRADAYQFRVSADIPANSGATHASIASPKVSFVFGPFKNTEYYLNYGESFHSNDGRGTTITVDPGSVLEHSKDPSVNVQPLSPVTPLVRARGAELGLRTNAIRNLRTTIDLFDLRLGSELVFNGDGGNTSAGRPSQRTGVELANFYTPNRWLTIDADAAYTTVHFSDVCSDDAAAGDCGAGNHIPGGSQVVVAGGITVDSPQARLFGSLRYRYFGPRPLIEDNSRRSAGTALVNVQLGTRTGPTTKVLLDVFNLLNARASDIDYYYASRLPSEPTSGVNDIHFHPAVPRTLRLTLSTHG